MYNPSIIRRNMHATLQTFEVLHMQSFKPSKDHIIIRRVEGLHTILQPFEWLHLWSFEGLKIECDHSTLRMIMWSFEGLRDCMVIRRAEGLRMILRPFEGLHLQSLEELKDCAWSFNPSKDYKCNHSTLQRIMHDPSTLWRTMNEILQPFQRLHF